MVVARGRVGSNLRWVNLNWRGAEFREIAADCCITAKKPSKLFRPKKEAPVLDRTGVVRRSVNSLSESRGLVGAGQGGEGERPRATDIKSSAIANGGIQVQFAALVVDIVGDAADRLIDSIHGAVNIFHVNIDLLARISRDSPLIAGGAAR